MALLKGFPIVNTNIVNEGATRPEPTDVVFGNSAKIEDTNLATVLAAPASGRSYITDVLVTNGDATVGTLVTIRDSAGVVICQGYAAAAGGGFSHSYTTHVPLTAGASLVAVCSTTSAEVYVSVVGYRAA